MFTSELNMKFQWKDIVTCFSKIDSSAICLTKRRCFNPAVYRSKSFLSVCIYVFDLTIYLWNRAVVFLNLFGYSPTPTSLLRSMIYSVWKSTAVCASLTFSSCLLPHRSISRNIVVLSGICSLPLMYLQGHKAWTSNIGNVNAWFCMLR